MNSEKIMEEALNLEGVLVEERRYLHAHPETGFDLSGTVAFVKGELEAMGYEPQLCGRAGLVAMAGGKKPGKVFLIRGDMDALPICEESGVEFSSENNGKMHACGHDMHTTMLLGAAKLLKEHEDEIEGTVKLMFQPAEEIFAGAKDMIDAGVLKDPDVDAALMIHVMSGIPMPAGMAVACDGGISAPAADYFEIQVQGKGCHGSMPNAGVDPITAAAHIVTALQEINARELAIADEAVLTVGSIHGGQAANVIPDTVVMSGTIRTFNEEIRSLIKKRIEEIAASIGTAFRAEVKTVFGMGCPVLDNNEDLSVCTVQYLRELLGPRGAFAQSQLMSMAGGKNLSRSAGSEDFAYVSQEVPTIMLGLAAGEPAKGYSYPQHHPKVKFDEEILGKGSAVYAYCAMRWLEEHK